MLMLSVINARCGNLFALFGTKMKDFFKYLTVGDEDKNWGLYLNVAGKSRITPRTIYPSREHPTGYFFNWNHGRTLEEFQLNYITEGAGILETDKVKYPIKAGSLMIIKPGIRHRYRPHSKSGWVENYIGFEGELAHRFLDNPEFFQDQAVMQIGIREELIDTYYKIFDQVQQEEPGFQQISSGLILKLLGYLVSFRKRKNISGTYVEKVIQEIRFHMRENIHAKIDLQQLADEHQMSYAYLRKMFKKYTGVSPHQYHLEMKIMGARELILSTDKSIKEISYELGFESIYYFSRLFKKKTGVNPSQLRKVPDTFEDAP